VSSLCLFNSKPTSSINSLITIEYHNVKLQKLKTRTMKSTFIIAFYLTIFNFNFVLLSFCQDGKVASLPQKLTVHQGQEFELLIFVHPGSEPVSVVDLILTYDTLFLKAISIDRVESPLGVNQIEPSINPKKALLSYSAFTLNPPPDYPFQLVSVQFKAINETPATKIYHDLKATFKTTLAYAGRDNLNFAPDIDISILPEDKAEVTGKTGGSNQLVLNLDNPNVLNIDFAVKEHGATSLKLVNEKETFVHTLFDNTAVPGVNYFQSIDLSVLPSGSYNIKMEANGVESTNKFVVVNSKITN
jgi:hypothetical protein